MACKHPRNQRLLGWGAGFGDAALADRDGWCAPLVLLEVNEDTGHIVLAVDYWLSLSLYHLISSVCWRPCRLSPHTHVPPPFLGACPCRSRTQYHMLVSPNPDSCIDAIIWL